MGVIDTGWLWLLAFAAVIVVYLVCIGMLEVAGAYAPLPLPVAIVFTAFVLTVFLASILAELALIGGLGLLAWEAYTYSELGHWPWRSGFEVLSLLNVHKVPATDWAGFDRLVTTVMSWPVLLTTVVPDLYSIGAALVAYHLYSWWSDAASLPIRHRR